MTFLKEYTNKINKGYFVTLKVTVLNQFESKLEVVSANGVLIQEENGLLPVLQISMLKIAGEYKNSGTEVIINPFTN